MNSKPIKVLLVTYVFPPFAAVGVYRILKLCKYFPEFGIEPVILTPENPNVLSRDENLIKTIPENSAVYRTLSCEPFRVKQTGKSAKKETTPAPAKKAEVAPPPSLLSRAKRIIRAEMSIPDSSYLWSWTGFASGVRAVNKQEIDLIFSSAPPQSVHLLASRISRFTKRPLVVDFRDLWTQNTSYAERRLSSRLAGRDRKIEESVLRHSSGITVNTSSFRDQLTEKNSFLDSSRIEVVTNGVDPDDFRPYIGERPHNQKFTILYSGSLYGTHRDPEFFFRAVRQLVDIRPDIGERLRLLFVGNWSDQHTRLVDSCGVADFVDVLGWLPQKRVLDELFGADLLLLIQGFDPVLSSAVPRKLYEYIISGRPILSFAPKGEIPRLIDRYDAGACFHDSTIEPIIQYLIGHFDLWQKEGDGNKMKKATLRPMPELETRAQVQKAATLIKDILSSKG